MYSNIVLGHLTHQSKAFYGVLLNDVIEISLFPRVKFMTQLTDNPLW